MSTEQDLPTPFESKPALQSDPAIPAEPTEPIAVERITTMSFRGPLPPPHVLEAYNHIVPNGAERIFLVFEKQVEHRQALERKAFDTNARLQDRGFYAAFFLALTTLIAGFWLSYLGRNLAGMAAIISSLASLITVFVVGRNKQDAERDQKKTSMRRP